MTVTRDTAQPIEWSFLHNTEPNLSSTVPNLSYGTMRKIYDKQADAETNKNKNFGSGEYTFTWLQSYWLSLQMGEYNIEQTENKDYILHNM